MLYDVRLFIAVRTDSIRVEANSQEEAITLVTDSFSVKDALIARTLNDEEIPPLGASVDEIHDIEYENTRYHQLDGANVYISDEPKKKFKMPRITEAMREFYRKQLPLF